VLPQKLDPRYRPFPKTGLLVLPGQEYLKALLPKLRDGSVTEIELSSLVRLSRLVVEAYLRRLRPSADYLCNAQGITASDLAYDCIGSALARDERGAFRHIVSLIDSLTRPLESITHEELFFAYRGFLTRFAEIHLAHLYAQADSVGAKIHRNIRNALKGDGPLQLARDFRGYVVRPARGESLDECTQFPEPDLSRAILERLPQPSTIPALLELLHEVLVRQSIYRRSVPLADVVHIFKRVYQGRFQFDEAGPPGRDGLSEFEIEDIRKHVELALKEKILFTYLARGKMDRREAEGIFSALHDILVDWCAAERSSQSNYEYLRRHLLLSQEDYDTLYRVKMEYLLKIARDQFAAHLAKDI